MCAGPLTIARDLVWQVKMLLINIFAVEICNWLGQAILFVGFPVRQSLELEADPACGVAVSLFIVTALQKMSATAIYAIMVYVFLKYGVKKLKWQVICTCIAVSWVVSLGMGTLPNLPEFGLFNNNGFCETDPGSVLIF